jgi:hypothetical protein
MANEAPVFGGTLRCRIIVMTLTHSQRKRLAGVILSVALAITCVVRGVVPAVTRVDTDFPNYLTAAKIVADGGSAERLYDDSWFQEQMRRYRIGKLEEGKFYPFPPPTALCSCCFQATPSATRCDWGDLTLSHGVRLSETVSALSDVRGLRLVRLQPHTTDCGSSRHCGQLDVCARASAQTVGISVLRQYRVDILAVLALLLFGSLAFAHPLALPVFADEARQLGWVWRVIDAGEWLQPLGDGKQLEAWPLVPLVRLGLHPLTTARAMHVAAGMIGAVLTHRSHGN